MVLDSAAGGGVCAVDREGKVILWNDGAERVTGYLRQDVLGRMCTEAFLEHADTDNNPMGGNALPLVETMRDGKCVNAARVVAEEVRAIRWACVCGRCRCAARTGE